MVQIIAVTNQKGGVGKTTTAINLSACLAAKKNKVLLIDADPQGNASTGCGIDKNQIEFGLQHVLLAQTAIENTILTTAHGFSIIPSNSDLTAAEVTMLQQNEGPKILQQALKSIATDFDYIIIDCPPALNTITLNALVAAQQLLIPMQCEYFALEGLASLISTMQQIQQHLNPNLKLLGILRTLYDARNRLSLEVSKQLQAHFPNKVFNIAIPKNIKLAEAPSHGLPANIYAKYSAGAKAYMILVEELMSKKEISA